MDLAGDDRIIGPLDQLGDGRLVLRSVTLLRCPWTAPRQGFTLDEPDLAPLAYHLLAPAERHHSTFQD